MWSLLSYLSKQKGYEGESEMQVRIIKRVQTYQKRLWLEVKEYRGANPLRLLDAAIPVQNHDSRFLWYIIHHNCLSIYITSPPLLAGAGGGTLAASGGSSSKGGVGGPAGSEFIRWCNILHLEFMDPYL